MTTTAKRKPLPRGRSGIALVATTCSFLFLAWLQLVLGGSSGHAAETAKVGDLGDVRRIDFEGETNFSAAALRGGLGNMTDFGLISHPCAPLADYVQAIQERVRAGYQHCGFADAHVSARSDAQSNRIVVKIEEGSQFLCGEVIVTGARQVPAAAVVEALTTADPGAAFRRGGFQFQDWPPLDPAQAASKIDLADAGCLWKRGTPAHFADTDLAQIQRQVTNTLSAHGFVLPEFNVHVVRHPEARTADLQVEIADEGPRGTVHRIELFGNAWNSRDDVLHYLDLKPDMQFTSGLVPEIEGRLWHSARFLTSNVTAGPPDSDGRLTLQISMVEFDDAPPLSAKLSREEKAMLQLRDWLSHWGTNSDALMADVTGVPESGSEFQMALCPARGLAILKKARSPGAAAATATGALVMRTNSVAIYAPDQRKKVAFVDDEMCFSSFVSILGKSELADTNKFNLTCGAGLKSASAGCGAEPGSPYDFQLTLAPVAFLSRAHSKTDREVWFEGDTLVVSNADFRLTVDARTGRLMEVRWLEETAANNTEVRAYFEPGGFDRLAAEIESTTREHTNIYRSDAAPSSLAAFIIRQGTRFKPLRDWLFSDAPAEARARIPDLAAKLPLEDILMPVARVFAADATGDTNSCFDIPECADCPSSEKADILGLIVDRAAGHSGDILPAHSWGMTLLREAALNYEGHAQYTGVALQSVYDSNETGPLGFLVSAGFLSMLRSPMAPAFAKRGLERLSTEDFRRDYRQFLQNNTAAGQFFLKSADALRDLNDSDIDALALGSPSAARFLRDCARRLRESRDRPVAETLGVMLDDYWQREWRDKMAAALRDEARK